MNWLALIATLFHLHAASGPSTIFGNQDGQTRDTWACRYPARRQHQTELSRRLEAAGHVVALPSALACWCLVIACIDGACGIATVGDVGPRPPRLVDLWHEFASLLGHSGRQRAWILWSER